MLVTEGTIGGKAQFAFVGSVATLTALLVFTRVQYIRVFSRPTMSFQSFQNILRVRIQVFLHPSVYAFEILLSSM